MPATVRLELGGNLLMVSPWQRGLERSLTVRRRLFNAFSRTPDIKEELLWRVQELAGVRVGYIPAGLYDRVADMLDKRGVAHETRDNRKWATLPEPDWTQVDLAGLRPGQEDLLVAVAANQEGVLEAPTGDGKGHCIVQICRMYPKLFIVISTARRSVVKTLYDRLAKDKLTRKRVAVLSPGKALPEDATIVVTTTKMMDRLADRCDLLMLDECHCAAADGVAQALAKFGGARRFGFSASPKGRGDKADLLQEALLGPVRHERTYAESVEAGSIVPIDVSMIKYDHPPRMFAVRLSMKRNGIWRNNIRNDVIARVADAAIKRGQTLIMCETVEHVMELRRRLPGWTTVFATCDREWYNSFREAGYTDEPWRTDKEMLAIQDKFAAGEIQGAICTGVWREGVDLVNLRVLIRADGLAGMIPSIQIPGRLSRRIEGKDRAELIDFHDEFNNDMMQATMARVRAYKSKGWSIKYVEKIGV